MLRMPCDVASASCSICTVDTDVLILGVSLVNSNLLQEYANGDNIELWVMFGTGAQMRFIATHEIGTPLSNDMDLGCPAFQAFTGCDTVHLQKEQQVCI